MGAVFGFGNAGIYIGLQDFPCLSVQAQAGHVEVVRYAAFSPTIHDPVLDPDASSGNESIAIGFQHLCDRFQAECGVHPCCLPATVIGSASDSRNMLTPSETPSGTTLLTDTPTRPGQSHGSQSLWRGSPADHAINPNHVRVDQADYFLNAHIAKHILLRMPVLVFGEHDSLACMAKVR